MSQTVEARFERLFAAALSSVAADIRNMEKVQRDVRAEYAQALMLNDTSDDQVIDGMAKSIRIAVGLPDA